MRCSVLIASFPASDLLLIIFPMVIGVPIRKAVETEVVSGVANSPRVD